MKRDWPQACSDLLAVRRSRLPRSHVIWSCAKAGEPFFFSFFFPSSSFAQSGVAHRIICTWALSSPTGRMRVQLKVHGPKGEEKIIDLCDSDRELRRMTVTQLRDKVAGELRISTFNVSFLYRLIYLIKCTSHMTWLTWRVMSFKNHSSIVLYMNMAFKQHR